MMIVSFVRGMIVGDARTKVIRRLNMKLKEEISLKALERLLLIC